MILTLFGQSFSQTIKQRLPDSTLIIEVDGVEYRALPPAKMKEVLTKLEMGRLSEESRVRLESDFAKFRTDTSTAMGLAEELKAKELEKASLQTKFWEGEYLKEQKLRLDYENILKSCSGKIVIVRFCFK